MSTPCFLLKQLRIRCCSGSKPTSYLDAAELEGYYTRLLWTIPEEEEEEELEKDGTSHKRRRLIKPWKMTGLVTPVIKASPGLGVVGGDCNCSLLVKCMQLKSTFTSSFKRSRRSAKDPNNVKPEGINASSRSAAGALAPHRSKADEDQLRQQCEEICELYRAIAGGRLSLEKILNLRL